VRFDARVSIVFLGKLYLFGSQPPFDFFFRGVPRSQHSLLMAQQFSGFTHSFIKNYISSTQSSLVPLNTAMKPFVCLMNCSSLLPVFLTHGSYLSGYQQSLKLLALLVNQKATQYIECIVQSHPR
jgi:hypothetical protein